MKVGKDADYTYKILYQYRGQGSPHQLTKEGCIWIQI